MAEPAAPPQPEHVDPTGEWEIVVEVGGQLVDGVMTIEGDRQSGYTGFIDATAGQSSIIVQVDLDEIMIDVTEAQAQVRAVMTDDGVMEGEVSGAMGGGSFWASRISGGLFIEDEPRLRL